MEFFRIIDKQVSEAAIQHGIRPESLDDFTESMFLLEKGNTDFKGVYQAINQLFLENSGKNYEIVNREQDLDDEGLRKAKLSYHPVDFIKKYRVNLL